MLDLTRHSLISGTVLLFPPGQGFCRGAAGHRSERAPMQVEFLPGVSSVGHVPTVASGVCVRYLHRMGYSACDLLGIPGPISPCYGAPLGMHVLLFFWHVTHGKTTGMA